jgi:hypothetical protein
MVELLLTSLWLIFFTIFGMIVPSIIMEAYRHTFLIYAKSVKLFDENEVLSKAMNLFLETRLFTSVQDLVSHLGIEEQIFT